MAAAGKLFIDKSASKCPNNGALLGASRKMNCKESSCLVHIKIIHRKTKAEKKGPDMIHLNFHFCLWNKGVCIREVKSCLSEESDPSQKASVYAEQG